MITLMVAGLLAAIAVPSFQTAIANQRVKTFAQNLYISLAQARSEAIKLNGSCEVFIQPVSAADWSQGWYVVADRTAAASTANCGVDSNAAAFDITNLSAPRAAVIAGYPAVDRMSVTGPAGNIDYNRRGRVTSGAVSYTVCDADDNATKRLVSADLSGLPEVRTSGNCP